MINSFQKQRGLTLIELMIAMVLGLVVVYAVTTIMISNNQTATITETTSQAQDNGRFAMSYLNRRILRAGYNPNEMTLALEPFADLCDPNNATATYGMCTDNSNNENDAATGDRIAIRRVADNNLSCFGTALSNQSTGAAITSQPIVVDAFWVEVVNGVSSLYCQTFDAEPVSMNETNALSTQQPIVAGIAAMHVLYGEAADASNSSTRAVTRYIAPEDLDDRGASYEKDWKSVHAVKISILTEAFDETNSLTGQRRYILLDAAPYLFEDRINRQVFSTAIARANFGGNE